MQEPRLRTNSEGLAPRGWLTAADGRPPIWAWHSGRSAHRAAPDCRRGQPVASLVKKVRSGHGWLGIFTADVLPTAAASASRRQQHPRRAAPLPAPRQPVPVPPQSWGRLKNQNHESRCTEEDRQVPTYVSVCVSDAGAVGRTRKEPRSSETEINKRSRGTVCLYALRCDTCH